MKIVMTLLVRDEEDILRCNLDFHLAQGADHIIVTDNRSTDSTPEILADYAARGLVTVINETAEGYNQADWVTRMARLAYTEHGADWVINADADEFWWPKSGNLKTLLATVPAEYGVVKAPRVNFLPRPDSHDADQPFFVRMLFRDVISADDVPEHHAELQPKVCHRGDAGIEIAQGNHSVLAPSLTALPGRAPIIIFHFPIRSYAQFERKIVNGGRAYEQSDLPENYGEHWRNQYALWKEGRLKEFFDERVLSEEALAARIRSGEAILDRRLISFMARLTAGDEPESPAALHHVAAGDDFTSGMQASDRTPATPKIVLAFADELLKEPEMLHLFAHEFAKERGVGLAIYAPDWLAEEAASEIVPLVNAAGFSEDGTIDLQLLAVPSGQEEVIASQCVALYTANSPEGAFRALPALGPTAIGALRSLIRRR